LVAILSNCVAPWNSTRSKVVIGAGGAALALAARRWRRGVGGAALAAMVGAHNHRTWASAVVTTNAAVHDLRIVGVHPRHGKGSSTHKRFV
jgi:hypothetical protein